MRPTDDEQNGSKSPPIIPLTRSSRDGQNETTLARLERAGPRRSGTASGRAVRLALLGGSGLLVVGMVSALVSLTRDNVESLPVLEAATPEVTLDAAAPLQTGERAPPILDERDDRHITTVDTADPPALVRMTSDLGDRPDAPAAAKPSAVRAPLAKPAPAKAPAPARVLAASAPKAAGAALLPRPAAFARKAPAPLKPAAASIRKNRPAIPAIKVDAAFVDTDVALLSAILSQASRHASERIEPEAAACAEAAALNRRCTDKATVLRP
ncbi:MAG: hypothetical protein V4723_18330 [Pseudomonadota bacterium]